jgi:hypothetical protein
MVVIGILLVDWGKSHNGTTFQNHQVILMQSGQICCIMMADKRKEVAIETPPENGTKGKIETPYPGQSPAFVPDVPQTI